MSVRRPKEQKTCVSRRMGRRNKSGACLLNGPTCPESIDPIDFVWRTQYAQTFYICTVVYTYVADDAAVVVKATPGRAHRIFKKPNVGGDLAAHVGG